MESCHDQSAACEGATLKDRVNVILRQRHSTSYLTKVRSPRERLHTPGVSTAALLQGDPSLKLRVKTLMKSRRSGSCVLPRHSEAPDVSAPPPSQSVTSAAPQESSADMGFQCFLSVLNKGMDVDLLSRIVTDNNVDLLNFQPPVLENKPDPPFGGESQPPSSRAYCRSSSVQRETHPPRPDRLLLHGDGDGDGDDDRGQPCSGSGRRSGSTPAVKKKEEKAKADEQQEHLQNILKTLGLSLGMEEMSRLADRTQERLYGRKHKDARADGPEKQESQQKISQKRGRSPSCSSTGSASANVSCSPPRHRRSPSQADGHSECRPEPGSSGDRDANHDSRETQRDTNDSSGISTHQHPFPRDGTYPPPHPAAYPEYPGHAGWPQYSGYSSYDGGYYGTDSYYQHAYTEGGAPSWSYPSGGPPKQPPAYDYDFHWPGEAPVMNDNEYPELEDSSYLLNPDLSASEDQTGQTSRPRCVRAPSSNLLLIHNSCRWKRSKEQCKLYRKRRKAAKKQSKMAELMREAAALKCKEAASKSDESKVGKQLPTEEDMKANLSKKLEAFNQKVKQKQTAPADSLAPQTG